MRTVLVTGGRHFADRAFLFRELDKVRDEAGTGGLHIIHGGASGADALAGEWAEQRGVTCTPYPAHWKRLNGSVDFAAVPKRNQRMLDMGKPDLVVAFAGLTGTADMVRRAVKAGVPVRDLRPTGTRIARNVVVLA